MDRDPTPDGCLCEAHVALLQRFRLGLDLTMRILDRRAVPQSATRCALWILAVDQCPGCL